MIRSAAQPWRVILAATSKSIRSVNPSGGLDLRRYLDLLEETSPSDVVHVTQVVDPAKFEVTAVLQKLEEQGKYPLVIFERPLDLHGEVSDFPIVTNVYATRERCAIAMGLRSEDARQELSLESPRREERRLAPVVIDRSEAPVKQVVQVGDDVDLGR